MTRKELISEMEKFTGSGLITQTLLMKFMGYSSPQSVVKYTRGLEKIDKRYFIPDVADRILEGR